MSQFRPDTPGGAKRDIVVREPNAGHHHCAIIGISDLRKANRPTAYLLY